MRRFSAVLLILFCLAATSRHASWLSSRTQSRSLRMVVRDLLFRPPAPPLT